MGLGVGVDLVVVGGADGERLSGSRWPVLIDLASLSGQVVDPQLLSLQVFAVEARYEEGPFPLPAERPTLLHAIEALLQHCERAIASCAADGA